MNVILFGATGMVGQGVLHACLKDPGIASVVAVTRTPLGVAHKKLEEIVHDDFSDFSVLAPRLRDLDACFFCLGVSSAGMSEADYTRVTYDITMTAARVFAKVNPRVTFIYVSGAGTDGTEKGRSMWARVKGKTENDILALLPRAIMFRPGFVQPMDGIRSKTGWYRGIYAATRPLFPVIRRVFPKFVTNTRDLGAAMIEVAEQGSAQRVLASRDITALAATRRADDSA